METEHEVGRLQGLRQIAFLSVMAILLGFAGGAVAYVLFHMIGAVTNLLFYGRVSVAFVNPFDAPFLQTPWPSRRLPLPRRYPPRVGKEALLGGDP